ncbi:hypothetical protein MRX96_017673 [Rhipicephalus microplus]
MGACFPWRSLFRRPRQSAEPSAVRASRASPDGIAVEPDGSYYVLTQFFNETPRKAVHFAPPVPVLPRCSMCRLVPPEAVQERLVSARLLLPLRGARPAELPFRLHRLETRNDGRRRLGARFKGLAVLLEQRRRMRVLRQFVRIAVSLPPVSVLRDPMWSVRTGGLDEGPGFARQVLLSLL